MLKLLCRILALVLSVVLTAAAVVIGVNLYVCGSAGRYISDDGGQTADCVLVLGCAVQPDGKPSLMLRDRLDAAIELYKAGAAPKLLMSGDHGTQYYDEVNAMKDYAMAKGVPSEDIFMDHAGFNTYDSLYRARDVFGAEKVIVVTQSYHLYRAVYIGRSLGMEVTGVAAEEITYEGWVWREAREVMARVKDFGLCFTKPLPTVLGEGIDLTGSGDVTNDR